jgi:hypothetical protein
MATVTGLTAARMKAIEDASVVDGGVVMDDLILTKYNGVQINAGNVRGPIGVTGNDGEPAPVAAWTNPVLLNSWVDFGGSYETSGYYLDRKRVFIKGLIKSGVMNTTLFDLPEGSRPPLSFIIPVITGGGPGTMEIRNTGAVVLGSDGTNGWVSISNVSFRID